MTDGLRHRVHQLAIAPKNWNWFQFPRESVSSRNFPLRGLRVVRLFLNVLRFSSMLRDVRIYRTEHRCVEVPSIDQLESLYRDFNAFRCCALAIEIDFGILFR